MKSSFIILICLSLYGCATPGISNRQVEIGMTKEQVFWKVSSPLTWHRQIINNKVYETWTSGVSAEGGPNTYDFVDNILVGYGRRGRYYFANGTEDVRMYINPSNPTSQK